MKRTESGERGGRYMGLSAAEFDYPGMEADRAFFAARFRGLLRDLFGKSGSTTAAAEEDGTIPLAAVAGMTDPVSPGGGTAPLPVLPRSSRKLWLRTWAAAEAGEEFVLEAVRGRRGWYLAGGLPALAALEVLRARGARAVRVKSLPSGGMEAPRPVPACPRLPARGAEPAAAAQVV